MSGICLPHVSVCLVRFTIHLYSRQFHVLSGFFARSFVYLHEIRPNRIPVALLPHLIPDNVSPFRRCENDKTQFDKYITWKGLFIHWDPDSERVRYACLLYGVCVWAECCHHSYIIVQSKRFGTLLTTFSSTSFDLWLPWISNCEQHSSQYKSKEKWKIKNYYYPNCCRSLLPPPSSIFTC